MCGTCGCSDGTKATVTNLQTGEHSHLDHEGRASVPHRHDHGTESGHGHSHGHGHEHDHDHSHAHAGSATETVPLETRVLAKNDALAERNRAWLTGREVLALNLVSSPGSGKTSLLERTIRELGARADGPPAIAVIEGDQQTQLDAERIRATGAPSVQVNTGSGCHLEADMVWAALQQLRPEAGALVLIENVGNLVCPALFDLGEDAKVAVLSVTEGEDKPVKYPNMFREASLILLNKIDLLPHLDFDVERCIGYARDVNPEAEVLQVSVKSGEGLERWYEWIEQRRAAAGERAFA